MGRWLGGVFGNTKLPTDPQGSVTGRYTISDHYYMRREGGWVIPYGAQSNPITTGPAAAFATGAISSGVRYYWTNIGNATANSPKEYEFVRHDNKSWVKITDVDFSGDTAGTGQPNFNYSSTGVASSPTGWKLHNGNWYWCAIPTSRDTEGWNDWDLGSISFRYWRCTVHWAPMNNNGGNLNAGHPDNDNPGSYRQNDPDFNSRSHSGGSNVSWHRFGIANVQHCAHSDLGFTGERQSVMYNISVGNKSADYASGVSRIGTGSDGYWDLGGNAANRIFRVSSGDESGAGGDEQHAWCPHEMWLSDG